MQIDHFFLALYDTLSRFRPPVHPNMIKVRRERERERPNEMENGDGRSVKHAVLIKNASGSI